MAKVSSGYNSHFGGRLGKGLIYGRWKNIVYVRRKPIPPYSRTPKQAKVRNIFAAAVKSWQNLDIFIQYMWRAAAYGTGMSGYELWIKNYIKNNG